MSDTATDGRTTMNGVHAVLLTLPFTGHMNPMLHLARRLAAIPDTVCRVTFVLSDSLRHRPRHDDPASGDTEHGHGGLSFVYIPDGTHAEDHSQCDTVQLLQMMETCFVRHFEQDVLVPLLLRRNHDHQQLLLQDGEAQEWTVNGDDKIFVIANAFIPGADRAVRKHGVPFVSFWPQSAASFAHLLHVVGHGYRPPPGTAPSAFITIPGVPVPVQLQDFNGFLNTFDPENHMYGLFVSALETSRNADCLLMNTLEELEMGTVEFLGQEMKPRPVMAVGPLLPDWFVAEIRGRKEGGHKERNSGTGPWKKTQQGICGTSDGDGGGAEDTKERERKRCMAWLEAQEEESVVYVSFGSMASTGEEQAKEMAEGLERSGAKFVWSLKKKEEVLERGWEKRMEAQGRGLVMEWAPQLALLAHPAIAAFLTHCGWNSTMEAITAGVPLLAWRTGVSDQAMNARLAADAWHQAILLDSAGVAACPPGENHIAKSFTSTSLLRGDEVRRKISALFEFLKKREDKKTMEEDEEPKRWCRTAVSAAAAESSLRVFVRAICCKRAHQHSVAKESQ